MPFFEYLSFLHVGIIHDDGTKQGMCQKLTKHEQILQDHENHGRPMHRAHIFVELVTKTKESRRKHLQDATFDNDCERLRSSVLAEWQAFAANPGSVMYSVQRAAREVLSLHGSLHHLKQRASQTWLVEARDVRGEDRVPKARASISAVHTKFSVALQRFRRCT